MASRSTSPNVHVPYFTKFTSVATAEMTHFHVRSRHFHVPFFK